MVTTRRSSLKRVEVVANAAVNEGQQQLNQVRRQPSGYARRGPPKKIKTQYGDGDDLADNSHLQLKNADVGLCDRKFICFDTLESSEPVIPPKKPQHRQKTVIPDPKEFDKFHSSGQLDLLVRPFKYELPAASNSSSMSISGSGATKNADSLNSVQGRVLSNCFLGNRPQKSASFNLTEIAEKMANDGLDEVDSFGSETKVSVGGYNVKPKYEVLLGDILSKYGDIGVNCSQTRIFRSYGVELVCEMTQMLMDTNFVGIKDNDVEQMMSYVEDLEKENLDIVWLKERLNVIREAKQAFQILKSAKEKKCDAELKAEFKKRGQQLEDYKRVLAVKEVEVEDLKKKVLDAERDFVTMKDMVAKVEKLKSENRAKLRHALNLGSLGHGLI